MTDSDPHIHVEDKVVEAGGAVRAAFTAVLGVARDAPSVVTTGCGRRVPYAMTSPHPESVTCLPCREHAAREHRRFAEQVEQLSRMPGAIIPRDDAAKAVHRHRDLASRFAR
ncbi:hypothetical protein [Prauserella muralis]|uniref:Uncharacterized protein n=1 Tax=Prauserella muralis TaxID=588067 RepID=A0A2V4ATP5_9PSEU|nr:hypothetical protein [Prauserella muralis]PXY24622.1 hypothetical protein BAY60_19085 [Prauserella muralis]TWE27692.1 hypothetical protein FHX69_0336 [Prauserella muralis]